MVHHVKWPVSPVTYRRTVLRTFIHVRISNYITALLILFTDSDDHTRVELKKDPEVEGSDYINASFIDVSFFEIFNHCDSLIHIIQGYPNKTRVYVAAQGTELVVIQHHHYSLF